MHLGQRLWVMLALLVICMPTYASQHGVSSEVLVAAVGDVLSERFRGRVSIRPRHPNAKYILPVGALQVKLRSVSPIPRPQANLLLDLVVDGRLIRTLDLPVFLSVSRKAWFLNSHGKPGDVISCTKLSIRQAEVALKLDAALDACNDSIRLKHSLNADAMVTVGAIARDFDVHQGDLVLLNSTNGAVRLETKARALANGNLDEVIFAQPIYSKEVVKTRVIGPGQLTLIWSRG